MDTPIAHPEPTVSRRSWWVLGCLMLLIWGGASAWQLSRQHALGESLRHAMPDGRITLYTTATCGYCAQAKSWLRAEQVPFTECQVDGHAACAERFKRMGEPGVPVVQVDEDQFRLGFDAGWLLNALQRPATR
jgi:glutaredoxin